MTSNNKFKFITKIKLYIKEKKCMIPIFIYNLYGTKLNFKFRFFNSITQFQLFIFHSFDQFSQYLFRTFSRYQNQDFWSADFLNVFITLNLEIVVNLCLLCFCNGGFIVLRVLLLLVMQILSLQKKGQGILGHCSIIFIITILIGQTNTMESVNNDDLDRKPVKDFGGNDEHEYSEEDYLGECLFAVCVLYFAVFLIVYTTTEAMSRAFVLMEEARAVDRDCVR